jgi:hypothetical protein
MKLYVSLPFRNGHARFSITQESKGVYLAQLEHYEGPPGEAPPAHVILTRSFRRWRGSADSQDLLDNLGQAIEEGFTKSPSSQHHTSTPDESHQPNGEV